MKENLCGAYMKDAGNDKQYYEIFFEMCRKFRIDWATADEKEKGFVTEVTRVTYERERAAQEGISPEKVRPAFSA